jgi:hypothetical protein
MRPYGAKPAGKPASTNKKPAGKPMAKPAKPMGKK